MITIRTLIVGASFAAVAASGFAQAAYDDNGQIVNFHSVRSVQDVKAEAVAAAREEATVGIDNGQTQAMASATSRDQVRQDTLTFLHAHANEQLNGRAAVVVQ